MKTFTVYFCVHVITVATKVRLLLIAIYLAYLGVIALWMQAVLNKSLVWVLVMESHVES